MTAHALEALARRCETEEPSRELDRAIWLAVVPGTTYRELTVNHPKGAYVIHEERQDHRLIVVPSYSSSLDAAVTLVPDAHMWSTSNHAALPCGGWACVRPNTPQGPMIERMAAIPALALCAAALRARAKEKPDADR